jgi:hypothetical protein
VHEGLIDVLAVIGAVSCLIWLVKAFKALTAKDEAPSKAVADITAAGPASDDIAAITAVVYAIVGPHRIVEITATEPANDDLAAITAALYAVVGPHRIVGIDAVEPANDDVAAITAAIYAVMATPHRIIHIENGGKAPTWAAEGRWMHQTSHRPH